MAEVAPRRTSGLGRFVPLLVLLGLIGLALALDLHRYLSFESLKTHREALLELVARQPLATALGFVGVYAVATAVSLPGGVFLTLAGGFMFGTGLATVLVVAGATIGAVAVFLIAKTALGEGLRARAGPWLARMEAGFRQNALSYLLVLRLVPLFPFWLVNLVPAFLGVSVGVFALATFVGIIPGSAVFASVGAGLGAVFDRGETPDLGIIFEPKIILPLIGLALLSLLPVAYRHWQVRKRLG